MKAEQRIYKAISDLFDFTNGKANFKRTSEGFMPLHGEILGESKVNGKTMVRVSLAHYYEQNGDLVCDPDMEFFLFPEMQTAYAATIQHNTGAYIVAMKTEGGRLLQNPRMARDLQSFAGQWVRNLKAQGFFKAEAVA